MSDIKLTVDGQQYERSQLNYFNDNDVVIIHKNNQIVFKPVYNSSGLQNKGYQILTVKGRRNGNDIIYTAGASNFWCNNEKYEFQHDFTTGNGNTGCEIHSVKRLSDGEIFIVGDKFMYNNKEISEPILGFKIADNNDISVFTSVGGRTYLKSIGKINPKVPLFTTDDDQPYYGDTKLWIVHLETFDVSEIRPEKYFRLAGDDRERLKYYSTYEAATEFVTYNKPVPITLKDFISDIREGYRGYYQVGIPGEPEAIEAFKKRVQI